MPIDPWIILAEFQLFRKFPGILTFNIKESSPCRRDQPDKNRSTLGLSHVALTNSPPPYSLSKNTTISNFMPKYGNSISLAKLYGTCSSINLKVRNPQFNPFKSCYLQRIGGVGNYIACILTCKHNEFSLYFNLFKFCFTEYEKSKAPLEKIKSHNYNLQP
jgi:hypothetical protein